MKINRYSSIFHHLNKFIFKGNTGSLKHSVLITARRNFSDWHIVGALCLERKPIITQPLTPLELRYFQYLQKLEFEKSYLSEHEKRHINDIKIAEKLKKGELDDMDVVSKQTAQDFEDASLEELNKYTPSSRTTEADKNNNRQSLQRKLDASLVLVIKQKLGNDFRWILPQAIYQDGETLRQTAERILHDICPSQAKVQFMGNAPVGYYKYKYPKVARESGVCGAKVFFFKAQLLENNLQSLNMKQAEETTNELWLTHSELNEVLHPDYGKAVQSFLVPDTFEVDDSNTAQSSTDNDEPVLKSFVMN